MQRRVGISWALLAGLLALALPIAATLYLAQRQARAQEYERLQGVADTVLRLSAETRAQINQAIAALKAEPGPPCSEALLARMRQLDAASTYLQAVGHVRDGRLICSSLGLHGEGLLLGEGALRRRSGIRTWAGIRLPFVPGHAMNVYEQHGFAAIVNPELVMDALGRQPGLSLALAALKPAQLVRSQGEIKLAWLDGYEGGDRRFEDGDRLVVIRAAADGYTAALVAAPAAAVQARIVQLALVLVPLGLTGGLLMAWAILALARQRLSLPHQLRSALRGREFFMVYQPLIDLQTRRCVGAEALIRWRRRDGSVVSPDEFIPVAEQSGLIRAISAQVLEMVGADCAALLKRRPDCHISINLSAADLEDRRSVDALQRLADGAGIAPAQLMIEATERGFMKSELAQPVVAELRRRGFRVAIDDFGTGYSSLSYLERFELDVLKIDKCFVDTLGTDAPTSQVALHIIEMAKSLRLQTVAEGVEEEAQAEFLAEREVQWAQGWLFGKPMPIAELERFLAPRSRRA